ncbi:MAG TPA: hypothetical protein VLF89_07060 [Candidatus Saccharimonadales bacterium]|nr:hypothetical protein [Candidatus Saccharimonadales bacterium]
MKVKKIDKENLKLLINLKSLYVHANNHSDGKTITDRMIAILNFDNCIEWLLKILVSHYEIEEVGKEDSTPMLAGKVEKFLSKNELGNLPFKLQVENLHGMRNMIQHGQVFPPEEIKKLSDITYKFISKVSDKLLLIKFEHVSLAELILNKEVKKIVLGSEKFKNTNKMEYIVRLRDAFDLAVLLEEQKYFRTLSSVVSLKLNRLDKDITYLFDEYEKNFRLLALGINFKEYAQYEEILFFIPQKYKIDWRGNTVLQGDFSNEQIDFFYNFVVNSILNFQNINYLEKPISSNNNNLTDYKYDDLYNGYHLPDDSIKLKLNGMGYIFGSDEGTTYNAEKKYITHDSYLKFKKFTAEQIVIHECKRWKNDILTYHIKRKLKITGIKFRAVRHNPGIWEYFLGYEEIKNSREILLQKTT